MSAREVEHALALLWVLSLKLEESATLKLSHEEQRYLSAVCADALAGHPDPLRIGKAPGGQPRRAQGLREAELVHAALREHKTLSAACAAVGEALKRDGGKSGAVEKNYRKYREALEAADRFYAARNAGRQIDAADVQAILGTKGRGK